MKFNSGRTYKNTIRSNVGKAIITHPQFHHFYRWYKHYKPFPVRGCLLVYPHKAMPSKQCPVTPNSFWMANPVLNTGHFTSYMGMEHHGTHDMGPMGPAKKNVDHLI